MQAALLLVFLLILLVVAWININHVTDGFTDHNDYVTDRLKRFGNVGLSLLIGDNTGALGDSANNLLSTRTRVNNYPTIQNNSPSTETNNPLSPTLDGLFGHIKTCEAIQTMDCSAFDDPAFRLNCGICFFDGAGNPPTNSKKAAIPGGGLVLLDEDKQKARKESTISNFIPNYTATVGFCPASNLVSTKEECIKLKRQLYCEKNGSYDVPGCAQCYSNSSFTIVDPVSSPGVISGHGSIALMGAGTLSIQEQGFDTINGIKLSNTRPYIHELRVNEGDRVRLVVVPETSNQQIYLAGSIFGSTFSGEFSMDLNAIVISDEITGRKPRNAGKANVNDTMVIKMSPGFGKKSMTLALSVPFTFVDTTTQEASTCKDAPFVTTAASANFLQSNPCFQKGSGPGLFNMECLQSTWINNGCTQEGSGYPSDASTSSSLMSNPNGSFRTINEISDFVYNKALITSSGINGSGVKQNISSWSAASKFCTGVELLSPCDGANKGSGPLSAECIIYLWKNEGINNSLGATYTGAGTSLFKFNGETTPQYCQPTGTLSPIDENGQEKSDVIAFWQTQGGVANVKSVMNNLYSAANAQAIADDMRAPYFKQCYGPITYAQRPPPPPPIVYKCPSGSSPFTSSYTPKQNRILVNNFKMTPDYVFTMYITPQGGADGWASILHMTTGQDQGPHGTRALGIWFYPGSTTKLAMHIDHSTQPGWCARVNDQQGLDVPFTIGKTSMLVLTCNGPNISITVDGQVCGKFTHDGLRYSGNVTVYGSNPWYNPANCTVEIACMNNLPSFYPVCAAGSEQGMPACKDLSMVRPGSPEPACGERVTVFGKPNFGEYNFSIPVGQWNTLDEIRRIPGNNRYTIHGGDGNVSFAFPKTCPLRLTINNGENFSGPVTFVFTKTCPNSIYSGACGQITFDRRWDYAKSIKCEKI